MQYGTNPDLAAARKQAGGTDAEQFGASRMQESELWSLAMGAISEIVGAEPIRMTITDGELVPESARDAERWHKFNSELANDPILKRGRWQTARPS
jgi:hypothetical protein